MARRARFPTVESRPGRPSWPAGPRTARGASGVRLSSSWAQEGSVMSRTHGHEHIHHRHETRGGRKTYLCAGLLRMGGCTARDGGGRERHARALLRRGRDGLPLTSAGAGALPAHAHARLWDPLPLPLQSSLFLALARTALLPPRPLRLGARAHVRALLAPLDDVGLVLCFPCFLLCG